MSKRKVFGLAAAALLAFGIQQIAGAVRAAAEDSQAGASDAQPSVARAVYNEGRPSERHGNIYGSHGVVGQGPVARRGFYGAVGHRPHYYAHRYYRPRAFAGGGYYGARRYNPRYYAHRYYPARPVVAGGYYGATGYYPQYYAQSYNPAQPVYGDGVAVATTSPFNSVFAPTNWSAACVNGRVCTRAYYRRGVPMCRSWAACNY